MGFVSDASLIASFGFSFNHRLKIDPSIIRCDVLAKAGKSLLEQILIAAETGILRFDRVPFRRRDIKILLGFRLPATTTEGFLGLLMVNRVACCEPVCIVNRRWLEI